MDARKGENREEKEMTLTEKTARRICTVGTWERKEAEKMMGVKLADMTKEQIVLASQCIAAFAQLGAFANQ